MRFLTTSEQLKQANSSISFDFKIKSIESFINQVELNLSILFGESTLVQVEGSTNGLSILRMAIADLSLAEYSSSGSVVLDDSGIHVLKSDKKLPASDKKLLNYKTDALERGWKYIEQLIVYIEANPNIFTEWKISEQRKQYFQSLFADSTEFTSFGGLSISAHLFKVLKPLIRRVEDDVLDSNFGQSVIEDLRTKRLSNTITPALKNLERRFMRIVAPLALAEAIPMQLIKLKEGGVFQSSIVALGNSSDNIQSYTAAEQNRLALVLGKLEEEGNARLVLVKKWINEHASDYAFYNAPVNINREDLNIADSNIYLL